MAERRERANFKPGFFDPSSSLQRCALRARVNGDNCTRSCSKDASESRAHSRWTRASNSIERPFELKFGLEIGASVLWPRKEHGERSYTAILLARLVLGESLRNARCVTTSQRRLVNYWNELIIVFSSLTGGQLHLARAFRQGRGAGFLAVWPLPVWSSACYTSRHYP